MLFERTLVPHANSVNEPSAKIDVEIDWEGRPWIYIVFRASGFEHLALPPKSEGRADNLWENTCCEIFGQQQDGGYAEFNLSPSTSWAAYRFSGYRNGMAPLEVPPPRIAFTSMAGGFELSAFISWSDWPHLKALGISAVTRNIDGVKAYWALRHPSDVPDFHHPGSFVLKSPALELP